MIYIKNTQRKHFIDTAKIEKNVQTILDLLEYADFDISIWFTTEPTIQKYNKTFRNKNKPTDVISFPYHTNAVPDLPIMPETADDKSLGDILIAPAYIEKHLIEWEQTFDDRITTLLVHSICHLLGYDHETDEDYARMMQEEDRILDVLHMSKKRNKG